MFVNEDKIKHYLNLINLFKYSFNSKPPAVSTIKSNELIAIKNENKVINFNKIYITDEIKK